MGPERHKVVAQDGTLFSKGGCITGGLTGNEQNRAARFEEQDTAALKQARTRSPEHGNRTGSACNTSVRGQGFAASCTGATATRKACCRPVTDPGIRGMTRFRARGWP